MMACSLHTDSVNSTLFDLETVASQNSQFLFSYSEISAKPLWCTSSDEDARHCNKNLIQQNSHQISKMSTHFEMVFTTKGCDD